MAEDGSNRIVQQIARIEELRYLVSVKTYELLGKKKHREEASGLEIEIEGLKKEMNEKLSTVAAAGIDYISFNKKHIDELREKFLALPIAEKGKALEGTGEGKLMIDELNALLKNNYDGRREISTIIAIIPKIFAGEEGRKKLKAFFQGEEGSARVGMPEVDDPVLIDQFVTSTKTLGYYAKIDLVTDSIYVGKDRTFHISSDLGSPLPFLQLNDAFYFEPFEIANEKMQGYQKIETSASAEYSEEDLNKKINAIVRSQKMQRWVLNTFKDENEKADYLKYQSILTTLMRMRRKAGVVKQIISEKAARLWLNNERVSCFLETIKSISDSAGGEMKQDVPLPGLATERSRAEAQPCCVYRFDQKIVSELPLFFSYL